MTWAKVVTRSAVLRIDDPSRYLAIGVVGQAVEDRRRTHRPVQIACCWLEWADVPRPWVESEGVLVLDA